MAQKKAYCFTFNNYSETEYNGLKASLAADCKYAILGRETGESGTPHIQGYALFKKPIRFKTCVDRYLPKCHVQVASGSPQSNRNYCSKDGLFWEHGECPSGTGFQSGGRKEGKRGRDEIATSFVDHARRCRDGLVEFAKLNPGTWYYSGSSMLRNYTYLVDPCDRPDIKVSWYWGPPGVGKSRKAHQEHPAAYIKEPRTKWWNNYFFEKEVIIDDFGPQGIDINHLLRWFDRYKCYVETKGGMISLAAEVFVVTSNFHPSSIFSFAGEENVQLPALMRRIECIEFT